MAQKKVTLTRHVFDRALRALPVGQHPRVWELYFKFVKSLPESQTALLVYRRYIQVRDDCNGKKRKKERKGHDITNRKRIMLFIFSFVFSSLIAISWKSILIY